MKNLKLVPLQRRSTFMAIIEVTAANPNGDPDNEGRPRQRHDGCGWMTAVSIKRKIRDLFDDHESLAFRQLVNDLGIEDEDRYHVFESFLKGSGETDRVEAIHYARKLLEKNKNEFLNRYIDIRHFGGTCLFEKSDVGLTQTGVITMSHAVSVAPVLVNESTMTKKAPLRLKLAEGETGDIAPMGIKMVEHGLYVLQGVVNPNIARHTLTTEADIEAFKVALKYAFSTSMSASRPAAQISFARIWWADHTNVLGSFNEQDFFKWLTPVKRENPDKASKNLSEYDIPTPKFDFEVHDISVNKKS